MKKFFKKILFFLPLHILLFSSSCIYSMYPDNINNKEHSFFDDNPNYKVFDIPKIVNNNDELNRGFLIDNPYNITSFGFSLNGNNVSRSDESIVSDSSNFISSTNIRTDNNTDNSYEEEEEAIIRSVSNEIDDSVAERNKFVKYYFSIETALSDELLHDRERMKISHFYEDMKRFSIPIDSSYIVLFHDHKDNHIYLIVAFDTINEKIYFKRTDSWYRFDIYHLKNEIENTYLGLLADITCDNLDSFEKIELYKNHAYDYEKNACYYPNLDENLINKSKLLSISKKFNKILKNPKLKKNFLKDLRNNIKKSERLNKVLNRKPNNLSNNSICNYLDNNN